MAGQPIFKHWDHSSFWWSGEGSTVYIVEAVGLPLVVTRVRFVKIDVPEWPETDPSTVAVRVATLTAQQFASQRAVMQDPVLQDPPVGINVGYTPVARAYALWGAPTDWYQNTPNQIAKIAKTHLSTKLGQITTLDQSLPGGQQITVPAGSFLSVAFVRSRFDYEDSYDFELFMTEG